MGSHWFYGSFEAFMHHFMEPADVSEIKTLKASFLKMSRKTVTHENVEACIEKNASPGASTLYNCQRSALYQITTSSTLLSKLLQWMLRRLNDNEVLG